jgi:hypothetical protein
MIGFLKAGLLPRQILQHGLAKLIMRKVSKGCGEIYSRCSKQPGSESPAWALRPKAERDKVHEVDGFLLPPFAKRKGANNKDPVLQKPSISLHQMQRQKGLIE